VALFELEDAEHDLFGGGNWARRRGGTQRVGRVRFQMDEGRGTTNQTAWWIWVLK
jgi:hypothetical protein